jgi:hypothetical protein
VGDHPVKVPEELVKEWMAEFYGTPTFIGEVTTGLADRAAQWAWDQREPELQERADQELEACVEWLEQGPFGFSVAANDLVKQLRAARRPKPPSLAGQALEQYKQVEDILFHQDVIPAGCIRAALNRLAELEAQQ